uniref:Uncharacterized protein n=1 Tax=Glossina palpalis gambiensis TaxID=67801 RepID=A0A1B0BQB3_9MUSC
MRKTNGHNVDFDVTWKKEVKIVVQSQKKNPKEKFFYITKLFTPATPINVYATGLRNAHDAVDSDKRNCEEQNSLFVFHAREMKVFTLFINFSLRLCALPSASAIIIITTTTTIAVAITYSNLLNLKDIKSTKPGKDGTEIAGSVNAVAVSANFVYSDAVSIVVGSAHIEGVDVKIIDAGRTDTENDSVVNAEVVN